ncbi:MAG: tetratricopeptide repeat protein [Prevotella sp.]|nr:tetratricopeptide repeat protein [Prevotella sp.]
MVRLLIIISLITCQWSFSAAQSQTTSQREYDLLFMEAMVQRQKGQSDAAFDLLNRCREMNPQASETYFFLAQYYSHMKQQDKALEFFKHAAQLEPANSTYLETLAQAYIEAEQYTEAVEVMERMYEADKSRQDLLETIYRLYVQTKDFEKAIGVVERMEAIDGKSERLSVTKSQLYMQLDDKKAAVDEMKQLAEQHPNDQTYQTLYANMLMMDDRETEACDVLTRVLEQEPDNTRAQMSLRTYYLMQEDSLRADSLTRSILLNRNASQEEKVYLLRQEIGASEQAGGDSTQVLALFHEILAQPDPDPELAELCAAYMNLKQMPRDSVSKMLEFVLQLAPDNASARLQLVQYAWEAEDDERIISLCRAARQYNPDEMAFYYYQGMAFYRQENHDEALGAFRNGISVITQESSPDIVSSFYEVMGDLLHQKGLKDEAYAAYDSCLQWKPDNISCLNNYAYYLSVEGEQLDRAEQMSQVTIKAEPENATYLDTYAWILFMQKRYSEARIYIDQAMQNDSLHSNVITEHGGDIYFFCGDTDEALRLWQKALESDPENKVLIRKIKRKKYIRQ